MKVLCVIGTRPEAIKMAPVIEALATNENIVSQVCVTGQHRQMLENVLSLFSISPDYELGLMREGQDLTGITGSVLSAMQIVLKDSKPDIMLVQGDTTTTMSASLAAYYEKVPIGHVEAGLRTGNIYSPWPEEINRRVASTIAVLHFAPTEEARQNLLDENVPAERILVTGNTVIDALLSIVSGIEDDREFHLEMRSKYSFLDTSAQRKGGGKKLILITGHRRESFGEGFEDICKAIKLIATRSDVTIVYPVHLNPNVREPVFRILGELDNINLLDPVDYREFVFLMNSAHIILTDSGGVQEEAPSLGKPVLVMRDVTERSEGVDSGTAKLVGTGSDNIFSEVEKLLDDSAVYDAMSQACNPYGDGQASQRILKALLDYDS